MNDEVLSVFKVLPFFSDVILFMFEKNQTEALTSGSPPVKKKEYGIPP